MRAIFDFRRPTARRLATDDEGDVRSETFGRHLLTREFRQVGDGGYRRYSRQSRMIPSSIWSENERIQRVNVTEMLLVGTAQSERMDIRSGKYKRIGKLYA